MISITIAVAIISASFLLYLAYLSFRMQPKGAWSFSLLMIAMAIHAMGYALELTRWTLSASYAFLCLQYVGIAFYPLLIFNVITNFAGTYQFKTLEKNHWRFILALIGMITLYNVLMFPASKLYYWSVSSQSISGFELLSLEYGPLFYLQALALVLVLITGLVVMYASINWSSISGRKRFKLMVIAYLIPLSLAPIHFIIKNHLHLDIWPAGFILIGATLYAAIKRYDMRFFGKLSHEMLLSAMDDMVLIVDDEGYIVLLNAAAQRRGTPFFSLTTGTHIQDHPMVMDLINQSASNFQWKQRHYDVKIMALPNRHGTMCLLRDISDTYNSAQQLITLARTDVLTSLFNRRYLDEYLAQIKSGSIALIDIDHFKLINDTYGHSMGDLVLIAVASAMRSHFDQEVVVRYGGEEFAIVFHSSDQVIERIQGMMQGIANDLINYLPPSDRLDARAIDMLNALDLTLSVGVSAFENFKGDVAIVEADQALYVSKREGRNRIRVAHQIIVQGQQIG